MGVYWNQMKLARLHQKVKTEPVWHVQVAVLIAIGLQVALNNKLTLGPKYIIAGFESVLLLALVVIPHAGIAIKRLRRSAAILLIALISLANIISLGLVVRSLFVGAAVSGRQLIASGLAIYLTNIIVFGLWYWELDSSGVQGQDTSVVPVDFLFPQMTAGNTVTKESNWDPTFFDYLYISVTNASAFSPTDTLPLTHRAKLLMTVQSLTSLLTVALVAARAVNILS